MLREYPEHIDRLQEVLNSFVVTSSIGVDPYDRALWLLEGRLETFITEARQATRAAEATGDQAAVAAAKKKELLMLHARGIGGLADLYAYVQENMDKLP